MLGRFVDGMDAFPSNSDGGMTSCKDDESRLCEETDANACPVWAKDPADSISRATADSRFREAADAIANPTTAWEFDSISGSKAARRVANTSAVLWRNIKEWC